MKVGMVLLWRKFMVSRCLRWGIERSNGSILKQEGVFGHGGTGK